MPNSVNSIDPSKTALIVVDMVNDFIAAGAPLDTPAGRAMLPTLKAVLDFCRARGIRIIYTTHGFRRDGCDLGRFADDAAGPIARHAALLDGTPGIEIYPEIAPHAGEIVVKKHRFSAFYGTNLEIILRGWGVDTVIITGVSTENCCHATARDALFRDYRVVFLSDATATFDYPDLGQGGMSASEVHRATLVILAGSTAHVMIAEEFMARTPIEHAWAAVAGRAYPNSFAQSAAKRNRQRHDAAERHTMSQYIFDNAAPQAGQRFDSLERLYDAQTIRYLEDLGISVGWHCLEVGAGSGSIARWLAQRAGATGHVLVTDIDPGYLSGLTSLAQANLDVQRHDIGLDPLPEQRFDLIHARLVLVHVKTRQEALARMVAALKPGGWLVVEDFDTMMIEDRSFPMGGTPGAALTRNMLAGLNQLLAQYGHEVGWGRNLYRRFREHGLVEVGMEGRFLVADGNSAGARLYRANFEQVQAEALSAGLFTEQELETFLALLDSPDFAAVLGPMLSAWGRRP